MNNQPNEERSTHALNSVNKSVRLEPAANGLLTIWLDTPNRSVNVLNAEMLEGLESAVEHAESNQARYQAVVFRSRKSGCFFVGADVPSIAAIRSSHDARKIIQRGQDLMLRIEGLTIPTIAAIDGVCMGGGLELALACQYRVVSDSLKTKLGLPEIKLGLIPGWGGTQRLPRVVGLRQALTMILTGKALSAAKAKRAGLVSEILSAPDWQTELEQFIARVADGKPITTTRQRGLTDVLLDGNWLGHQLVLHLARRKVTSQLRHYPALGSAIQVIGKGCRSRGTAYAAECDAFVELLSTDTARSLLGLFVQRDRAKKWKTWTIQQPAEEDLLPIRKIAVIGAGAMGAGIGALAASKGFEVVFKEIHEGAAEAGRKRVGQILQKKVDRKQMRAIDMLAATSRIKYSTNWKDTADCDLAVEAVLEIEAVKREVFEMLDRSLRPDAIIASNTSSLCVTRMGAVTGRQASVAGLHFFNPVDRMELIEVVRTETTSERTLASLLKFVQAISKTPIVTSDKPGFLVNRVLFPYLGEAVRMVSEGYDIVSLDRQLKQFGMPMGPLELIDQVGVDIASHVAESLAVVQPDAEVPARLLSQMVELGWLGKKAKRGFYLYEKSGSPEANHLISQEASIPPLGLDFKRDGLTSAQRRLVYPMLNEAVHCLDELVVTEAWMVDLGMVLGTGFAPMTGGPLRLIDAIGPDTVIHNMRTLAATYGERFDAADGLARAVSRKEPFFSAAQLPLTWENHHESEYTTNH